MIAYLRGLVVARSENMITMDVGGVGYGVYLNDKDTLITQESAETVLWIYSHYTQDSLKLYGFRELAERDFFVHLLDLSAVGPKLALAILARLTIGQMLDAIHNQDEATLKLVPGIGHKKAQTLMTEFKVRKGHLLTPAPGGAVKSRLNISVDTSAKNESNQQVAVDQQIYGDVRSALLNLGVSYAEAMVAIDSVVAESVDSGDSVDSVDSTRPGVSFESLFKQALARLAK